MKLLTLVNRRGGLRPDQVTTAIAQLAAERHGRAWLAGVDDVWLDDEVMFDALRVEPGATAATFKQGASAAVDRLRASELDVVLIRTNPGRDKARTVLHEATLNLCRLAKSRGLLMLNDPDALPKASDKLFLAYLPESLRPRMMVSRDPERLREFVDREKGQSVLKPVFGSQGRGVFRVRSGGPNLNALMEVLTGDGYVIAQEYLRRAPEGDTRVVVVDGKPLEVDGRVCAVRRVPSEGEFRSNVHAGGHAAKGEPTLPLLRAATTIAQILEMHGIWMAGIDMVGTKAVEINVRCPGGLHDAGIFEGVDFNAAVLDSIERRVSEATE
ncbi:MAG: hypothetical protein AB7S26_08560 [Sandaracinaceae bacterium]